ncbi:MAG: DUF6516 family protein [Sulfurisoma sp.]|nr:DUF6516 family protein [Sulfurisoma sp.]
MKFVARNVPRSEVIPHGIGYSITLHNRSGERVLGFDNAHRVGRPGQFDHWHRTQTDTGRQYMFESPEKLMSDFWSEVDRVLKELNDD